MRRFTVTKSTFNSTSNYTVEKITFSGVSLKLLDEVPIHNYFDGYFVIIAVVVLIIEIEEFGLRYFLWHFVSGFAKVVSYSRSYQFFGSNLVV